QLADHRKAVALVHAEGAQRAEWLGYAEFWIRGRITVVVEQPVGRNLLSLVVGDPNLALRDRTRRHIEDERRLAWQGNAHGHRVRAEARIASRPRSDDRARNHVDEVDRNQALGDCLLGPVADAPEMM